jgi:glycosyltransferase involved in cell wall biosynthesis
MTDPLGQSQVLPYLRGLAGHGYDIHLLSFEKPLAYRAERPLIEGLCRDAGITWHPISYTKYPPILSSLYDYFVMVRMALKLQKQYNFNMVHCRSYLPAMAGLKLKNAFGIKLLFDIRGFWADERVEGKIWNLTNPVFKTIYRFFKNQERILFNSADGIISLTQRAVPVIRNLQNGAAQSIPLEVIPCCVDTALFDPANYSAQEKRDARESLGISENAFLLTYLGGIGTWYKAEEMFDFFSRLLVRFPDAYFYFITREPKEVLEAIASKRNIPVSRIIVKAVSRKEMPLHLSIADASIYFIMDSYSKQASSPTKQGEVMSMGIPVICNPGVGDSSDILEANHTGYICKGYNAEAYDKIVADIKFPSKPEERKHIREVAIKNFSLADGVRKYLFVYKKLLQE